MLAGCCGFSSLLCPVAASSAPPFSVSAGKVETNSHTRTELRSFAVFHLGSIVEAQLALRAANKGRSYSDSQRVYTEYCDCDCDCDCE